MVEPNSIAPFVTSASLWPPRLVHEESAWNEHIPFAGWIVEAARPGVLVELGTHTGVSYFAFCESVRRLDVAARCFAVDTWLGDKHAGFYGEEVHLAVSEMNARYYESFSTLLHMTFDEAAEGFADDSIDLIHIDGMHTYEAISHDFETWLPKLSDRGLVLMHDTNERREDFGVHRFFDELANSYDTFGFTHGHGLGVVSVGREQPQAVLDLLSLAGTPQEVQIRSLYEALGRRISAEMSNSLLSMSLTERDRQLARAASELDEAGALEKLFREEGAIRDRDLATIMQHSEILDAQLASQAIELGTQAIELDTQTIELDTQTIEAQRLQIRVAAIEGSRSWRMTAPLRFVADRVKALFR